jgi:AraC-like DNA-binding protein
MQPPYSLRTWRYLTSAVKPQPSTTRDAPVAPAFFSPQVGKAHRFFLDLDPSRRQSLTVVCGGLEHCAPDYAIRRNSFPYHCIEYVVRGQGHLALGRSTDALAPGHVFAYGPGISHEIQTEPGTPLVKYFVDFAGRGAPALLKSCGLDGGGTARVFPADCLAPLFDELIQCGLQAAAESARLCAKLLECLVLKIAANTAPLKDAGTRAFATYQRCRGHIEGHFLRLHDLEQISAECGANSEYICRLFRRYDHQSPYQYLLRLKMNHAAIQLQQTSMLVKEAAAIVGFIDAYHFSRVFHSVLGVSPAEFRKLR